MKIFLRLVFSVFLAVWLVSCLTGCQTIEGAGKDIQRGGEILQDAAR